MCPLKAKKVSVKATRYCPVLQNGCMNLILCILSHIYVCINTKIWLYRLIYHSYRLSSVISIYTVSMIYLSIQCSSIFIWYISWQSVLGFYRNISLVFVLTQIREATFQDDSPRSAQKSSGELEGGMYREGHTSELLLTALRHPIDTDIYVKWYSADHIIAVNTKWIWCWTLTVLAFLISLC